VSLAPSPVSVWLLPARPLPLASWLMRGSGGVVLPCLPARLAILFSSFCTSVSFSSGQLAASLPPPRGFLLVLLLPFALGGGSFASWALLLPGWLVHLATGWVGFSWWRFSHQEFKEVLPLLPLLSADHLARGSTSRPLQPLCLPVLPWAGV
jgi:hypothetical protein